jgi:hypothetical protein
VIGKAAEGEDALRIGLEMIDAEIVIMMDGIEEKITTTGGTMSLAGIAMAVSIGTERGTETIDLATIDRINGSDIDNTLLQAIIHLNLVA